VIIQRGAPAPAVVGVDAGRPRALVFYKAACSVTAMAGDAIARLGDAYPDAVVAVGQDPPEVLRGFAHEHRWSFPQIPDLAPYVASDAYGISSAPTVVVIDGQDQVADAVESWDRDAMNRVSATLAGLLGAEPAVLSTPSDGLPDFKPG
jgi:hypothetical protein